MLSAIGELGAWVVSATLGFLVNQTCSLASQTGESVVADIRRSAVAAAGIWLASFPMQLHPVTRRDGVISVFRGFSGNELREVCARAGITALVKRHPGWSLTAAWRPSA